MQVFLLTLVTRLWHVSLEGLLLDVRSQACVFLVNTQHSSTKGRNERKPSHPFEQSCATGALHVKNKFKKSGVFSESIDI